jgi:5-methylcytosine-specific restriction endonuclease McrA
MAPVHTSGANSQVDHIVAVTKGGNHEISNLQWTHWLANQMKFNQSEEEFVQNAMRIVANKGDAYGGAIWHKHEKSCRLSATFSIPMM